MDSQNPVMYKQAIIEKYIPLVKYLASRISIGKTKYIEYEDLVSYGIIGLMDAMSKFDSTKGMKFSSYASIRIRGSMIDEIRKNRPISKGAMDKLARYNDSIEKLQNKLMREPSIVEIAKDLNMTVSDIAEIENYINYMSVISLETIIYSEDDDVAFMGIIEDKTTQSPESSLEEKEKLDILSQCIEKLKEKDRLVLNLYYFEGLTLKEIGNVLGVSESRICQLHSRAIRNLRAIMEKVKYK